MLTITHINYIRDLYFSQGKSYNEICKITGRNFRTVKKYVMKEDFNEKKHKVGRPNKTDALRPVIKIRLGTINKDTLLKESMID